MSVETSFDPGLHEQAPSALPLDADPTFHGIVQGYDATAEGFNAGPEQEHEVSQEELMVAFMGLKSVMANVLIQNVGNKQVSDEMISGLVRVEANQYAATNYFAEREEQQLREEEATREDNHRQFELIQGSGGDSKEDGDEEDELPPAAKSSRSRLAA